MTKLIVSVIITFLFPLIGCPQNLKVSEIQKLNLDFEQNENGYPTKWDNFGSNEYKIYTDSTHAKNGKFSVVIENSDSKSDFKALAVNLPNNYKGKFIRLSGYINANSSDIDHPIPI